MKFIKLNSEYGIEKILQKNGIDTSMADRSVFGGMQEKLVLKQLEILNDVEHAADFDDYQQMIANLDIEEPDCYEKATSSGIGPGAVKTFTIDTVFSQIGGFGRF